MKRQTLKLAQTGILIALVLAVQYIGSNISQAPVFFGISLQQLVVGSLINMILVLSAAVIGLYPGATVGALSATTATLLGIGGNPLMLPVIVFGNVSIVLVTYFLFHFAKEQKQLKTVFEGVGVVLGAAVKCAVMWILSSQVVIPTLAKNGIPEKQIAILTLNFSWPQAVTAFVGGIVALSILPVIKKAASK